MNRFLLIAPFVIVCGALPAAPVPRDAGKPPLFFPTRVGTKLDYDEIGGDGYVQTITESTEKNGRYVITVRTLGLGWKDDPTHDARYEVSTDGVFRLAVGETSAFAGSDPPDCWLKLPHREGDKWGLNAKDRLPPHVAGKVETVKVPAGTFEAIRVDRGKNYTYWFARGVGIVKRRAQECQYELKAVSVPDK
jgi:hypothetical protein